MGGFARYAGMRIDSMRRYAKRAEGLFPKLQETPRGSEIAKLEGVYSLLEVLTLLGRREEKGETMAKEFKMIEHETPWRY